MDLRSAVPRSPRVTLAGAAGLARTTDKARAFLAGTLGEFHYGDECPHDSAVFIGLGIDRAAFTDAVRQLDDDEAIAAWLRARYPASFESPFLDRWNSAFLRIGPNYTMEMLPAGHPLHEIDRAVYEQYRMRIAPEQRDDMTFVELSNSRTETASGSLNPHCVKIGELALATGISAHTIRFYEREGILPSPARLRSGVREYPDESIPLLRCVAALRRLGMALADLRAMVSVVTDVQGCITGDPSAYTPEALVELAQRLRAHYQQLVADRAELDRLIAFTRQMLEAIDACH